MWFFVAVYTVLKLGRPATHISEKIEGTAMFFAVAASFLLGRVTFVHAQESGELRPVHYKKWRENPKVCSSFRCVVVHSSTLPKPDVCEPVLLVGAGH